MTISGSALAPLVLNTMFPNIIPFSVEETCKQKKQQKGPKRLMLIQSRASKSFTKLPLKMQNVVGRHKTDRRIEIKFFYRETKVRSFL
jgi:hypothetical protein